MGIMEFLPDAGQIKNKLVGARGFEPPTPCSRSRCATRLRYAPTEHAFTAPEWLTQEEDAVEN